MRVPRPREAEHVYEAFFYHTADGVYSIPFGNPYEEDFVTTKCSRVRDHFRNIVMNGMAPDANERPDDPLVLLYYLCYGPSSCMEQNIDMFKRMFQV